MSLKNRLIQKTGDLGARLPGANLIGPAAQNSQHISNIDKQAAKTGPGQMLAFRNHMQEHELLVGELEKKLEEFQESSLVKYLDPKLVRPSRFANRSDFSFKKATFLALKLEIQTAGGNIQPIKVRPIKGEVGCYEIAYGHRRHMACLQLELKVAAVIEDLDDKSLVSVMDRENRNREDLSVYEQGEAYRRLLEVGVFPSVRQLALHLGVDVGNASKAISIALLPAVVLAAFKDPTLIQYRWAKGLKDAVEQNLEGVTGRAEEILNSEVAMAPSQVYERITAKNKSKAPNVIEIKKNGKAIGNFTRSLDGSITIAIAAGVIDDGSFEKLRKLIDDLVE